MSERIEPCPSCQSDDAKVYTEPRSAFYVACPWCWMRGPVTWSDDHAVERWNKMQARGGPMMELIEHYLTRAIRAMPKSEAELLKADLAADRDLVGKHDARSRAVVLHDAARDVLQRAEERRAKALSMLNADELEEGESP